jgi:hypothetical protein
MRKKISDLIQNYPLFLWIAISLFSNTAYTEELPKPVFKLIKGQGTDVCEAYLQRLTTIELPEKKMEFSRSNYLILSGLTEPPAKDFDDLKPVLLTAQEIQHIYYKIVSFGQYRDQDFLEKYMAIHKNDAEGENPIIIPARKLPELIKKRMIADQKTPFIHYQKKLDMDNDGVATDTVIRNSYSFYIVDEKLQRIDEAKMMAILADEELLEWPSIAQFPPLAMATNVFSYKGKYYFDGHLNWVMYGLGAKHPISPPYPTRIGIFIHQQQQTQKVCEYLSLNDFREILLPSDFYFLH